MIKYEFYVTPPPIGGEIQGDTHTDIEIDRHTNLIGQADLREYRPHILSDWDIVG